MSDWKRKHAFVVGQRLGILRDSNPSGQIEALSIVHRKFSIYFAWSAKKKDWWYDKDPSTAKFLWTSKENRKDSTRRSLFIGRLAMALKTNKKESV